MYNDTFYPNLFTFQIGKLLLVLKNNPPRFTRMRLDTVSGQSIKGFNFNLLSFNVRVTERN